MSPLAVGVTSQWGGGGGGGPQGGSVCLCLPTLVQLSPNLSSTQLDHVLVIARELIAMMTLTRTLATPVSSTSYIRLGRTVNVNHLNLNV